MTDRRQFELTPSRPSIPSLKDGELADKAVTQRAIGRKRSGFGMALGDIVLPTGRNVEAVATEVLTRALREGGLVVLNPGDSGYEEAHPIEADVLQFWAWFTPGFISAAIDFRANLTVRAPFGGMRNGLEVEGRAQLHTVAARASAWRNTINEGLEELNRNLVRALKLSVHPGA